MIQDTDYGRPMKPFFIEILNFWAGGQTNWADKFWGMWGSKYIRICANLLADFGLIDGRMFHSDRKEPKKEPIKYVYFIL